MTTTTIDLRPADSLRTTLAYHFGGTCLYERTGTLIPVALITFRGQCIHAAVIGPAMQWLMGGKIPERIRFTVDIVDGEKFYTIDGFTVEQAENLDLPDYPTRETTGDLSPVVVGA